MTRVNITNEYFDWLYSIVCEKRFADHISFRKLLMHLHDIEFRYLIPNDRNRAEDGVDLRYRFALYQGYEDSIDYVMDLLDRPCTVLEMMIALAIRCEEDTMDDPIMGNRTGQWFWRMVVSLGLGATVDGRFDSRLVDTIIERFLNRDYEPNGKGGLFTIKGCDYDLRDVEIWVQLCWYLDSIM